MDPNKRNFLKYCSYVGTTFVASSVLDYFFQAPLAGLARFLNRGKGYDPNVITHAHLVEFKGQFPDGQQVNFICGVALDPESNTVVRVPKFDERISYDPNTNQYLRYWEDKNHILMRELDNKKNPLYDKDHPTPDDQLRYVFLAINKKDWKTSDISALVAPSGMVLDPLRVDYFPHQIQEENEIQNLKNMIKSLHMKCDELLKEAFEKALIDVDKIKPKNSLEAENHQFFLNQIRLNVLNTPSVPGP